VLSSFDLVLLGDWERDAIQRRSLVETLFGYQTANLLSDYEIAMKLGIDNIDEQVSHLVAIPSKSIDTVPRNVDALLFNHALNMTGSATNAIRPQVRIFFYAAKYYYT
jgi:hypothetical protein